jgi:regulator of protease activity HflC (stomatin/prohibitin superfamily)
MTATQRGWRTAATALAAAPLAAVLPLLKGASSQSVKGAVGMVIGAAACCVPAYLLSKKVLMVKKGEVHIAQLTENGTCVVLQAGIHIIPVLAAETKGFQTTDGVMNFGTITIIRVRPGNIGVATDNGKPALLLPGLHFYDQPNPLQFSGEKPMTSNVIQASPFHLIRVNPGQVGVATINGIPVLLEAGVHFLNEPVFQIDPRSGFRRLDEEYIEIGTTKIVVVQRGCIAKVMVEGQGHFLLEGRYVINQGRFVFEGTQYLTEEIIQAGVRSRVLVPKGKLGLALDNGEPILLDPGKVHLKDSSSFAYCGSVDITQQVVQHGSTTIVIVKDGQVGVSFHDGAIELLNAGRHFLLEATHVFQGFLSIGQQTLRIAEVTGMSSDNVELKFDAAICIKIIDAKKAVTMLSTGQPGGVMKEVQQSMQTRAQLALAIIIGNNSLNRKHSSTSSKPKDAGDDFVEVPESGGSFRQVIHDSFMVSFSKSMRDDCGIEVLDMSIEDVTITNKELAKAMASAAVANSELEKATIESETMRVKADASAQVVLIEAKGKASAMEVLARAEADRIRTTSAALKESCATAQQQELIRASADALGEGSTVMLAENTGALATLLSGAQGAKLGGIK